MTATSLPRASDDAPDLSPRSRRTPPGPRGLPVLGVAPQFAADIWGYVPKLVREYGDVVRVPLPGTRAVAVGHPDLVRQVFTRVDVYEHGSDALVAALIDVDRPSLPVREGADHKRVRRLVNPKFTNKALTGVGDVVARTVAQDVAGWEAYADSGEEFELQEEFAVLTMNVLLRSMFSAVPDRPELEERTERAFIHGHHIVRAAVTYMILNRIPGGRRAWGLPWPHLSKGHANRRAMLADIADMVAARQAQPTEAEDVLNFMLTARGSDGTGLDTQDIEQEMTALLFAGFETTANALAWTFGLLGLNPDILAEAYAEVDALPPGPIGHDATDKLPFVRACFDEAQRIQAAPFNARMALDDDELGGHHIPKGSLVIIPMYGLHHDERFWKRPHEFRPSRFLDERIEPWAFIPFGGGPHKCLGMRMAYMEAMLVLANILRHYRVEPAPGWRPQRVFHTSVGLKDLPVTVHRRAA